MAGRTLPDDLCTVSAATLQPGTESQQRKLGGEDSTSSTKIISVADLHHNNPLGFHSHVQQSQAFPLAAADQGQGHPGFLPQTLREEEEEGRGLWTLPL